MTPADWSNCSFGDYSDRSHLDAGGEPVCGEGLFGQCRVVRLTGGQNDCASPRSMTTRGDAPRGSSAGAAGLSFVVAVIRSARVMGAAES